MVFLTFSYSFKSCSFVLFYKKGIIGRHSARVEERRLLEMAQIGIAGEWSLMG